MKWLDNIKNKRKLVKETEIAEHKARILKRGIAKQVLIVRKDLNMRKGKIGAQCAHAAMGVLLKNMERSYVFSELGNSNLTKRTLSYFDDSAMKSWIEGEFTKICVYVNSEEELLSLRDKVQEAGLKHCLITDSGKTEFHGEATHTVLAIGPDWSYRIDPLTMNLSLL